MDGYLKQSTAATLKIGPFVDASDGVSAETGLTIAQADVRLSKNGGDFVQKTESTSCTHDELGFYGCPVDATDTGTLGRLKLVVFAAGAAPVWHDYMVVRADVYDSMCGTDYMQVDAVQVGGVTQTATDLQSFSTVTTNVSNILKINKNKWVKSGTSFIVYDDDGTTPLYSFTLDDATTPTRRTPV